MYYSAIAHPLTWLSLGLGWIVNKRVLMLLNLEDAEFFPNESFLFSKSSICCKECPCKPKRSLIIKGDERIMLCGTLESYPIEYRNLDGDF